MMAIIVRSSHYSIDHIMSERLRLLTPEEDANGPKSRGRQSKWHSIFRRRPRSRETASDTPKSNSMQKNEVAPEPETRIVAGNNKSKEKIKEKSVVQEIEQVRKRSSAIGRGLSPPKDEDILPKRSREDKGDAKGIESAHHGSMFDRTQWERTRFAHEASQNDRTEMMGVKPPFMDEQQGRETRLIGENRQSVAVRGEYLNEKPKFAISLLLLELIWCTTSILVWAAAADNPLLPLLLAIFNMLVVFLLILGCLSVEFFRLQVRRDDNRSETRFYVPYSWRYAMCEAHIARACLLCANITIMVFDDNFDTGSIIVLAATPFHLMIVAIQIFIAVKPKRE
ncbi:hypothetical protein GCK32_008454 [Trichostrongylus colubriformis]|uniref:Uncharacterized protein n=1 Tax=Trichostrongylus colubriformis TaxID=6319 RepID=A0AAN8IMY2_TRICO